MANVTKYFVLFSLLKSAGSKPVSPEVCAKELGFAVGSVAPYMWSLRKKFGADIEVVKNGRAVVGYKLLNVSAVESVITPKRRVTAGATTKTVKTAKVKTVVQKVAKTSKVKKTVSVDGSVPTLDADLDISEITDGELDDIKSQLCLA